MERTPLLRDSIHVGLLVNSPTRKVWPAFYLVIRSAVGFVAFRKLFRQRRDPNGLISNDNLIFRSIPDLV